MKRVTKKVLSVIMSIALSVSVCPTLTVSEVKAEENPVVLRFIVGSDSHMANTTGVSTTKFKNMFKSAYAYANNQEYKNIDAAILVGDIVDRGRPAEYVALKETMEACNIDKDTQIYMTMGNHEWWAYTNDHETSTAGEKSFLEGLADIEQITNKTTEFSVNIKGYQFIGMSPLYNDTYGQEKYDWMTNEVNKAKEEDSTKAIFTFQHHALKDTVYCSDMQSSYVYNNEAQALENCYNGINQVINFSGHSHAPINTPTAINQTTFTQYTTGSLYSIWLDGSADIGRQPSDPSQIGQYTIVEVTEDGNVRLMPYDVLTDKFFTSLSANDASGTQLVYEVDVNDKDNWKYTAARKEKEAIPYFESGAKVSASDMTFKSAQITFDQAKDDSGVYAYDIELSKQGETKTKKCRIYSEWYLNNMPNTLSYKISGLEAGTEYTAKVYPVDFFENKGNPLETKFTTADATNTKLNLELDSVLSDGTWYFKTNNSQLMTAQYYKVPVSIDGTSGHIVISRQNDGAKACIWPNFFEIYKMNRPAKSFRIDSGAVIKEVSSSDWGENGGDEITIEKGIVVKNIGGAWVVGDIEQEPDEDPEVYNVNHVKNGDFETGDKSNWSVNGNCDVVKEQKHSGNYAAKVSVGNVSSPSMFVSSISTLEDGKIYTISAWVYVTADSPSNTAVETEVLAAKQNPWSVVKDEYDVVKGTVPGQWTYYEKTFQFPEGEECDLSQLVLYTKTANATVYFDDVCIKRYHECVGKEFEGYDATYDKEGMKPGKKCPLCGKIYEGCEIIPKLERPTDMTTVAPETTTPELTTPDNTTNIETTTQPTNATTSNDISHEIKLKAKIKKVSPKRIKAKKLIIKLAKVNGAKKYEIQVSTTKKFKKVLLKKTTKKINYTFNSKKLKNKKKLFVRARVVGSTIWTKVVSVRIKK